MQNTIKTQQDSVTEYFDQTSDTYFGGYRGVSIPAHSFNIRKKRVYEMLPPNATTAEKVLDIGCGPGITAEDLVGKGFEFYGVDIAEKMIHECRKNFSHLKGAHFSVGSIEKSDFPDGYFDHIICMGVVEYIGDDVTAIKEMARLLKTGGTAIITLPNVYSPYRIWWNIILNRYILDFIRRVILRRKTETICHREYRESNYTNLLSLHGFDVKDVVYYNFNILPFPLDKLLPGMAVAIAIRLEKLCRGRLRWLSTGFIVKAVRR